MQLADEHLAHQHMQQPSLQSLLPLGYEQTQAMPGVKINAHNTQCAPLLMCCLMRRLRHQSLLLSHDTSRSAAAASHASSPVPRQSHTIIV